MNVTTPTSPDPLLVLDQAMRRRTVAIISHPDAGKSTLTEALLAEAGSIGEAGATHGKRTARPTVSDWMQIERDRGISISSAAVRIEHAGVVITVVDTPGHADFSEDTFRVLSAVDAAVMLLDAAKGVERQTQRLLEVCRLRRLPVITMVNKWDRPGLTPLDLLDEILEQSGMMPAPLNWPVGPAGLSTAMIDLTAPEEAIAKELDGGPRQRGDDRSEPVDPDWQAAKEEIALLRAEHRTFDRAELDAGIVTPVIFGAALRGLGVGTLLELLVRDAPPPQPRLTVDGRRRPVNADLSLQVFKVQSGMDPAHRDRVAFARVCSGRFVRGMHLRHAQSGRTLTTKHAQHLFGRDRSTLEEAWPGDVIGLVNASGVRPGDTLSASAQPSFPPLPAFPPAHFAVASPQDRGRQKQFRLGMEHLDQEGVIQLLSSDRHGPQAPLLGAVGPMQFEVVQHRMAHEFHAPITVTGEREAIARCTDAPGALLLSRERDCEVVHRSDGTPLAILPDRWRLQQLQSTHPTLVLESTSPTIMKGPHHDR